MLGIISLLVFAVVALAMLVIFGVINRALMEYERRYLSQSARDLTDMFYFVDGRQLLMLTVAVAVVLGLLGFGVANWFVGLIFLFAGFLLPFLGIRKLRERRVRRFEQQLVDALAQISSALRAGLSFSQAADDVASEMPPPLGQEFGLFVKELKLGVQQEEALQNLADRVNSEDLQLVATATIISKQLGGNMAEMYDTISMTIRERFRLEGKIRAITSQGKLQGWVVGLMPLILLLILNAMRPDLIAPLLTSTFGYVLFGSIIVMEILGILLIRRIVAIDV